VELPGSSFQRPGRVTDTTTLETVCPALGEVVGTGDVVGRAELEGTGDVVELGDVVGVGVGDVVGAGLGVVGGVVDELLTETGGLVWLRSRGRKSRRV